MQFIFRKGKTPPGKDVVDYLTPFTEAIENLTYSRVEN
jgi:hypothetical protein